MYDDALRIFAGIDTDGVKSGMKEVKTLVGKGMSALQSTVSAGVSAVSTVTKAVTGAVTAAGSGVLAFGGYAVKVGTNFESSMSQVIATMGITKDTIQDGENSYEKLANKAKEMGETTKFSASEAADALNFLALAGYDATKACDALPAVLQLAQAGNMDLARTSDLVTDAMSALGIDATIENLTHFGDVLAKTSSKSNTSVQQLGEALLVCGGQSKLAGLELEETSTLLGILADNGIKGSEGGTALRNLLKNMYTPTSQASKAMENLGISFKDSEGHLKSAQTLLIETMSALEKLSEADKIQAMSDIFDTRTIAAASAALNNSSERYNELYGEIMKCNGAMEQMAETQNDNLQGDIYSLKSAVEAVGISISEKLNPKIRNSVQMLTDYVRDLNNAFKTKGFKGFAQSLGDILGEAVTEVTEKVPEFINIGSDVVKSFMKGISSNSKILAISVSEIVSSLVNSIFDLFPMFITVGGQLVSFFVQGIANNFSELTEKAEGLVQWIYDGIIENLPKLLDLGMDIVEDFGDKLSDNSGKIVSAGAKVISIFVDAIKKDIPKVIKVAKQVIKDFANAIGKEIPVLKPFAEVIKFVANNFELLAGMAVGVWTAFKGYTIISQVSKAVSLLGDAVKIAGAVITANPLGLVFAGLGGAAALIGTVGLLTEEYKSETEKAIEAEQEYQEEIKKSQSEFQTLQDEAKNKARIELAPVDHVSDLAKELDNLADATGHVKDSDVERVNAILQTMNDVLGTDYSLVDGQIQKYDELKNSIDDVIAKKKAEIYIDANSDTYKEALQKYLDNDKEIIEQTKRVQEQQQKVNNFMAENNLSMQDYYDRVEKGLDMPQIDGFNDWIEDVGLLIEEKDSLDKLNSLADSYYETVGKYEEALGAYESGNSDKVIEIFEGRSNSLKNASLKLSDSVSEASVKFEDAKQKLDNAKIEYDNHIEKYREGKTGYGNTVGNDKNELAENRLAYYEMAVEAEKKGFDSYISVVESEKAGFKNFSLVKQIEEAYEKDKSKLEELEKKYAETGNEGTAKRIENLKRRVYSEKNALNDVYMRAGVDLNNAFGGEMSSEERIKAYVTTFGDNVKNCIADEKGNIYSAMSGLAEYGNFGFVQGMIASENFKNELSRGVQTVRDSAVSAVQNVFGIHSPSTVMRDEVGRWILPGIAVGVKDTVNDTADDINGSVDDVASQIEGSGMFTQQIELLREFSPKNNIPEIADERITEEMRSQLNDISVTLNADSFISKFENILANIGSSAVPQYSPVYNPVQSVSENRESGKIELPQNSGQDVPKINVYIGDTEIKDFVMSTIYEANAVSGGASV